MLGNKKQVLSPLFKGISFISESFQDFYKIFINSLNNVDMTIDNLNVPKILVIGSESSGKSSLLENIVKCQLFPKNSNFCTKIPTHLILKPVFNITDIKYRLVYNEKEIITNKKNIFNEISKIMNKIDDIKDEELTIEINEINMINFEFYDLPGIRAYPQELQEKTTKLTEKYLKMDNIIPICVIPATTPRITSYVPLALIKNNNKEINTILCLTMCDRLQEDNIEDLLINRLINNTDEFTLDDYAGICGIINRTHKNTIKLEDNDNYEKEWLQKNIFDLLPETNKHINIIKNHTNIFNLISILNSYYKNYISDNWIPQTVITMKNKLEKINIEIFNLGFDPTNENDIITFKKYFETILIKKMINLNQYFKKEDIEFVLTSDKDFKENEFIENDDINAYCTHYPNGENYDEINPNGEIYNDIVINYWRFENLNDLIRIRIRKCMLIKFINYIRMFKTQIMYDQLKYNDEEYINYINIFLINITNKIWSECSENILENYQKYNEFIELQEDEGFFTERKRLNNQKVKLIESILNIEKINESIKKIKK